MASPFSMFRKNQKLMIAILGILCMIAFVILPNVGRLAPSGAPSNTVVVTTKYGDLREAELIDMVRARRAVNQFLLGAIEVTVSTLGREGTVVPGAETQMAQSMLQRLQQRGLMGPTSESSVVETMILAKKAEEMGVMISDAAINTFLAELTGDKVSAEQFAMILESQRTPQSAIFDALRTELMASRLYETFQIGLNGSPPAQRWDYYQRFKLRATIEAVPVDVDGFVEEVSDPDDAALVKFYEQYKNQYALAGSTEPGFHQPAQAKFQYFKAEYEKLTDESAVTDEQIETYYQENRETRFRNRARPALPSALLEPDQGLDVGEPPSEAASEAESTSPNQSSDAAQSQEEQPETAPVSEAPDASQTEQDAAPQAPSNETPSEPAEAQSPEDPLPERDAAGDRDDPIADSLALAGAAEFVLRGQSGDGPQPSVEPATGGESSQPEETTPTTDEPGPDSSDDSSGTAGATPPRGSDEQSDSPESPQDGADGSAEPDERLPSEYVLPLDISDLPEWEYQPLWAVRNQIRGELARRQAGEEIDQALGRLTEEMNAYYDKILDWEDARQSDPDAPRPGPLNLPLLAGTYGVTSRETGLLSAQEVSEDTDLGKSFVGGRQPFARFVYENVRPYDPTRSQDFEGNQYLFWKIEQQEDYVPEFEEVRETVLQAWKRVQAREPARLHAEELAKRARSSSRSLAETFADDGLQVVEAGPFSWLTFGNIDPFTFRQLAPQLSEVSQIDQPGTDFMREVFELEVGQVGVAMNAPQTVAYIVRLASLQPDDEELQKTFFADSLDRYAMAGLAEAFETYQSWILQLNEEAGLDWVRVADAPIRR